MLSPEHREALRILLRSSSQQRVAKLLRVSPITIDKLMGTGRLTRMTAERIAHRLDALVSTVTKEHP